MKCSFGHLFFFLASSYLGVMLYFASSHLGCSDGLPTSLRGDSTVLLDVLSTPIEGFIRASSRGRADKTSHASNFQNAWYIDDKPMSRKEFDKSYAKEFRHLLKDPKFVPYEVPKDENGTSALKNVGKDPVLTTLRPLNGETYSSFHPVCHQYRFNSSYFPTVSVILPVQNERPALLSLTIHSVLGRTPPELLKEIILVDDDVEEQTDNFLHEIKHIQTLSPKVKYIRNERPLGCARSRMAAARQATGDVLVVVDSHVEMYTNDWVFHLLLPIIENPKTLSMQTLDILDDRPGHVRMPSGIENAHFGVVDSSFLFGYTSDRFERPGVKAEVATSRLPYESAFVPGSLFAVRRDEFWRLGGYDNGLAVWGGENTEFALKVWMCGFEDDDKGDFAGRIVVNPCSRVGHVYRIHLEETGRWPPPLANETLDELGFRRPGKWHVLGDIESGMFQRVCIKNNLRILYVWGNEQAMEGYLMNMFGVRSVDQLAPEWKPMIEDLENDVHIREQLRMKERNQCRDFDWFDRHVYYRLLGKHNPWHPSEFKEYSCGSHRANSCGECPKGNGEGWCNGSCHWCPHGAKGGELTLDPDTGNLSEQAQCVVRQEECRTEPKPIKKLKTVVCGDHTARSCGYCPKGQGETWCHGDCKWCENGAWDGPAFASKLTDDEPAARLQERIKCVPLSSKCRASAQ